MSPEYAVDGMFSMKSDVYSFSVLVLETVTGKKNRGFYDDELDLNRLRYVNTSIFQLSKVIDLSLIISDTNIQTC